ncbi:MAG: Nramp family divalent metal transporter [Planctomycetota bacterium]
MTEIDPSPEEPRRSPYQIGPGLLVTAAFIGPGTVVTASQAGAQFGCGLLWTIVFAVFGTIVLQSLAARVGIAAGTGLSESIRQTFLDSRWLRPSIALIIAAIGVGNTAYQTGNLTGAVAGITSILGGDPRWWIVALVVATSVMIGWGRYRVLHHALVAMVCGLSLSFLVAASRSLPAASEIINGLVPRVAGDSLSSVVALIGTTIVPYNLFLHASAAAKNYRHADQKRALRHVDWDTTLAVGLGGIVTAAILLTAATAFHARGQAWTSVEQISQQLGPALGSFGGHAFALGLFAAGLTSSITAPLATAYAVCGALGWRAEPKSRRFRWIAVGVILLGGVTAIGFGKSPLRTIQFAQIANGLLLPFIACFLLFLANRRRDDFAFSSWRIGCAVLVVTAVSLLGLWKVAVVFL